MERKPRILAASEKQLTLDSLNQLLQREGFEVITVRDGNQALDLLLHNGFDLVLLDMQMRYWNGISICRVLRANPQTQLVPVVLIAGQDSDEDLMEAAAAGADDFLEEPFRSAEVLSRVRSLLRLKRYTDEMERAEQVLFNLALRVEARDACTSGHCERLSRYSVAVADRLGLGEEQRLALRHASLLHDVGMIGVPEAILLKPAPLTPEERKVVETHPIAGEQICAPLRSMREVLPIIRHHHERFDGSGYPDGLAGTRIPITVRIFSVADVFDALTSDRPFRKALSMSQAITVMQEEVRLGWLDPAVVEVFESLITDPVQQLAWKESAGG